jgi:hypothetical protein
MNSIFWLVPLSSVLALSFATGDAGVSGFDDFSRMLTALGSIKLMLPVTSLLFQSSLPKTRHFSFDVKKLNWETNSPRLSGFTPQRPLDMIVFKVHISTNSAGRNPIHLRFA